MFTQEDEQQLQEFARRKAEWRQQLSTQFNDDPAFMYGSLRGVSNIVELAAFLKRNKELVAAVAGWKIDEQ